MATEKGSCPEENIEVGLEPSDEHRGAINSPCRDTRTPDAGRVFADDKVSSIRTKESTLNSGSTPSAHSHVQRGETGQGCSGQKTELRRGLKGRRLRAPSFKRRKF